MENLSCGLNKQKDKHAIQDAEIKDRLSHIKNKILVMSGLICPHCGENIDLFKSNGGRLMARKENVNLLASLPIEPDVVRQGDVGRMAFLNHNETAFTREFDKLAEQIMNSSKP